MIIFALSVTVLLGLAGLSIDVIRVYDLYAREQRAAEAGALAGDLYMPYYYSSAYTSGGQTYSAVTRALAETAKDGFTAAGSGDCTQAGVAAGIFVCQVSSDRNALKVTISQHIDVFLLSTVGVQGFNVSASATATYLTPFILGTQDPSDVNSTYFSDGGECSANPQNCKSNSPPNHFQASINGPAELKEQGDAFVACQEGVSYSPSSDAQATSSGPYQETAVTGGYPTNHYPGAAGTQPVCSTNGGAPIDQQSSGPGAFCATGQVPCSTAHAYNYAVTVLPQAPQVTVWIWNPSFIPIVSSGNSCTGLTQVDAFYSSYNCQSLYPRYGPVTPTSNMTDPRLYFGVDYSAWSVTSAYDRSSDQQVGTTFNAQPYDGEPGIPCANNQVYQEPTTTSGAGTCVDASSVALQYQWEQLTTVNPGTLGPSIYRVAVEAYPWDNDASCSTFSTGVCGWGTHSYGIKLCPAGQSPETCTMPTATVSTQWGTATVPVATVNPWTNMSISFDFQSSSDINVIPLADIPATFAGRTVTVSVFDPGDTNFGNYGNTYFMIVPPQTGDNGQANPTIAPVCPPLVTGTTTGHTCASGDKFIVNKSCPTSAQYCPTNNLWIQGAKQQGNPNPSTNDFNGLWVQLTFNVPSNYQGGQWWFTAFVEQGSGFDQVTIALAINGGSPIHLEG